MKVTNFSYILFTLLPSLIEIGLKMIDPKIMDNSMITRDEKDRPFPGPTRTGLGPDFRSWSVTDRGLGPDWSCPVRDFRTENGFFARNFALNAIFSLKL